MPIKTVVTIEADSVDKLQSFDSYFESCYPVDDWLPDYNNSEFNDTSRKYVIYHKKASEFDVIQEMFKGSSSPEGHRFKSIEKFSVSSAEWRKVKKAENDGDQEFDDLMDAMLNGGAALKARVKPDIKRLRFNSGQVDGYFLAFKFLVGLWVMFIGGIILFNYLDWSIMMYLTGALFVLFALLTFGKIISLKMIIGSIKEIYQTGALTPAVIVCTNPIKVVSLASMSAGSGKEMYGLKMYTLQKLPDTTMRPGVHVPCASFFNGEPNSSYWDDYACMPLAWATGDKKVLSDSDSKLKEKWINLENCVQNGLIPKSDEELLIVDENWELVEKRQTEKSFS